MAYSVHKTHSQVSQNHSQNLHKKISTHLLTVLIMRVILHIEQGKRDKRKGIPDVRRTRNDNTADWIVKI